MATELTAVVNVKAGDRILATDGTISEVMSARWSPATIGGCLLRQSNDAAGVGDRYSIGLRKANGVVTGISGLYDGNTCVRRVID